MDSILGFLFVETDQYVKWAANSALIISAVIVSVSPSLMNRWWTFTGFLVGHIIWTIGALYLKDIALLMLNGSFILLDLYAMTIRTNTYITYRRNKDG